MLPSVYDPGNDNYSITASLYKDEAPLPSWIVFDSRKFTITPLKGASLGTDTNLLY